MLNKAGRCSSAGGGGTGGDSREEDAEDVNKEPLASDKENAAAFVPLVS